MPSSSRQAPVVDRSPSAVVGAGGCWQDLLPTLEVDDGTLWQEILLQCQRVLLYSRHHWLEYESDGFDRQGFQATTNEIAEASPLEIGKQHGELVFCLYVLGCANLGLEEVAKVLSAGSVGRLVDSRWADYVDALRPAKHPDPEDLTLVELAHRLPALRSAIEQTYYRYSAIDGEQWFCSERLIPKGEVDLDRIPEGLCSGVSGRGETREYLRRTALDLIERSDPVEDLIIEIMRHALEDSQLQADHVTLTAPRRLGPIPEQDLRERKNIYRRTEIREGLELGGFEAQLGHASDERLKRVIAARMQVLKFKSAKHFFGPGCLAGESIDKTGSHMIFFNEDAHYRGHQNAGCSTGGRAVIPLTLERGGQRISLPGVFADLRVVRLSHDPDLRFTEHGLKRVIQYASWISTVLSTAYETEVGIESADSSVASSADSCPMSQQSDQVPSP